MSPLEMENRRSEGGATPVGARPVGPAFLSSIATIFGGQIASAAVALIIEVLCARLLGPEGRGQIALCMMVVALGTMGGGLGGEIPIILWSARSRNELCAWKPAVMFWGLVGSAIAVLMWISVFWFWHPAFMRGITTTLALIVVAAIPANIYFSYRVAFLTGFEQFRLRAQIAFGTQLAELAALLALILVLGKTSVAAVLGLLVGIVIGGVIVTWKGSGYVASRWNLQQARDKLFPALSLGLRGQMGNLATFFTYRLDVFVVNFFLGAADLGIYAVGVVVSEALWQVPEAAAVALFPRTARTIEDGATEFTCAVSRHVLFIATCTGIAIAVAAPILIPLVFGAQFGRAVTVIWWILPGTIALSLGKLMSADLAARGKPEYSSMFAAMTLAVTLILDFALIPRWGIQGAAVASSAAYFVDAALLTAKLRHVLGVRWSDLLVPKKSEMALYHQSWMRCRNWLGLQPASSLE
jgi:O-antigen/teichoic acid export membrane protein